MVPVPLVVLLRNYVGDVVLSLPALQLLESHGYALQLIGRGSVASLLAAYKWPVAERPSGTRHRVAQLRLLRREAVAVDPGFDRRENMLVFPNAFGGGLEPWLAGLNAVGNATEARRWLLARAEPPLWAHALEHIWALTCRFLKIDQPVPQRIELATRSADLQRADDLLWHHQVRPGFVAICPFAGGVFENQDKTWPAFPAFVHRLSLSDRDVVCCPGPGEAALAAARFSGAKSILDIDLGTYSGILRRAGLVVANDTGPGHIAAAVGAPLVSVLGPTAPEQWGAWGPTVTVVRHWPRWPSIEEVMAAAQVSTAAVAA
jgi:heptosyltransferase-2